MSVVVKGLTKNYGSQKAIDSLDFTINKGEIVGLLGPNGAGKTTTMKILTGYMPATSGYAEVGGHDLEKSSREVRKIIGYLPEHNPLYKEMYVREYLSFVADIMGVSNPRDRIEEMIEQTGLGREQHKLISALSKGYRQRVGLAQALLHDPEVLILDEPTSGLDPNQLAEIRTLIKNFGEEKTVIFSSHIMQEVQALCDRVIILNKGKIIVDDPIHKLQHRVSSSKMIHLLFNKPTDASALAKVKGVVELNVIDHKNVELVVEGEDDIRPQVFKEVVKNGWVILEMRQDAVSVEDIFQELTVDV